MTHLDTSVVYELEGLPLDQFKEEATKRGFRTQVIEENGKSFVITCEYCFDRVNVAVNDGIVTVKNIG